MIFRLPISVHGSLLNRNCYDIKKAKICSYNMTENIQNMAEPNTKI